MTPRSITRRRGLIIAIFVLLAICAWSPWLTESYANSAVIENLGGPDQEYNFPGEAMYIVTFWGSVI
jgi:hypothetical protein